jgi:protocatechuate 3,4-dioxygenase beta subunit
MSRVLAAPGVLLVSLLASAAASGQVVWTTVTQTSDGAVQTPPRDNVQKTGTAIIRGRVVAADTGQALRKAQVRIFAPELRDGRTTTTDAQGRYEFKELPGGRYTVSASKGSYVGLSYGQTRPLEGGKPIEIASAQTAEKIDFSLPKGSVITGRIVDEFGEAMADVQVSVQRYQYMQGRRRLVNAGRNGSTNDIGEFRIFGLAPGQYYLSATLRNFQMMGGETDDRSGYAPTYYPGSPNPEAAQKITVGVGQTLSDLAMTLMPTRTARVTGTAVDSQGKPFPGMVMMVQRGMFMTSSAGRVMPDGTFTINGVVPGEYTLQANGGNGMGMGGEDPEYASLDINVAGEDVSDIHLVATKAVTVTGRVIVDAAAAGSFRPGNFSVFANPVQPNDTMMMMGGARPGTVNDDFTFSVKVRPGKMRFNVNTMGPGGAGVFSQRAVRLNGVDIIDTGVDIKANEDLAGVEIEMTNIMSNLSGAVLDGRGQPLKDYTVLVFPQDRERWGNGSRYLRSSRPDQDGRFKITGLPPGDYSAVALDYLEPGAQTDPEFLDRLKPKSTPFSINEGETKTLDLKLSSSS